MAPIVDRQVDGYLVPKGWTLNFAPAGRHGAAEDSRRLDCPSELEKGVPPKRIVN